MGGGGRRGGKWALHMPPPYLCAGDVRAGGPCSTGPIGCSVNMLGRGGRQAFQLASTAREWPAAPFCLLPAPCKHPPSPPIRCMLSRVHSTPPCPPIKRVTCLKPLPWPPPSPPPIRCMHSRVRSASSRPVSMSTPPTSTSRPCRRGRTSSSCAHAACCNTSTSQTSCTPR